MILDVFSRITFQLSQFVIRLQLISFLFVDLSVFTLRSEFRLCILIHNIFGSTFNLFAISFGFVWFFFVFSFLLFCLLLEWQFFFHTMSKMCTIFISLVTERNILATHGKLSLNLYLVLLLLSKIAAQSPFKVKTLLFLFAFTVNIYLQWFYSFPNSRLSSMYQIFHQRQWYNDDLIYRISAIYQGNGDLGAKILERTKI